MKKLTIDEFWSIKHQIDDEVARIGWTKDQAKDYIKRAYNKSCRLSMTDEQLIDLLTYLRTLCPAKTSSRKGRRRRRK